MKKSNINNAQAQNAGLSDSGAYPTSYREVKIDRTTYCVTSVFTGEKELGSTLEKLAARKVLDEMDGRAKEILRNG